MAIEKGVKSNVYAMASEFYKRLQKKELQFGIAKSYRPKDEEGDQLPSESTKLQVNVEQELNKLGTSYVKLFDVTFEKDVTNTMAVADVVVDGEVLLAGVPVTYLLFLEKQLQDLYSMVSKLPVLDPSETWHMDDNSGAYATEVSQTTRTKKIPRNHVKAVATDKHPAQVELFFEDVIVGTWSTTKFSGAVPQTRVSELQTRVIQLQQAVKFARELANEIQVPNVDSAGKAVFDFLLRQ